MKRLLIALAIALATLVAPIAANHVDARCISSSGSSGWSSSSVKWC